MKATIIVLGAGAIAGATALGMPVAGPITVGATIGAIWPRRPALHAAVGGLLAWGGILALALLRAEPVVSLAGQMGGVLGVPGWVVVVVTLLYPAVLAASAAWLIHLVRRWSPPGAATARSSATVRKAA